MQIGTKIKALRLRKGLTQEELGSRTNLTKGYISQLERDLNSPSIDTLFTILEVLGTTPKEFFDDEFREQPIVYAPEDQTSYTDKEMKYKIRWLIPSSNEKEMEPVLITLSKQGEFRKFEPSEAETFLYVLEGRIRLILGDEQYLAGRSHSVYYDAVLPHQIVNAYDGTSKFLLVTTQSYL
jgi:transcriptional regulator with XRE-family HTH domain